MYTIEEFDKQKSKVVKYLVYKKRTKQEVIQKFRSEIQENMLEDILLDLEEKGYIDDQVYIERAMKDFLILSTLSLKEIQYKLYSKGVPRKELEEYFEKNEETLLLYEKACAQKIVDKKRNSMDEQEIQYYLKKKGYKEDSIQEAMNQK